MTATWESITDPNRELARIEEDDLVRIHLGREPEAAMSTLLTLVTAGLATWEATATDAGHARAERIIAQRGEALSVLRQDFQSRMDNQMATMRAEEEARAVRSQERAAIARLRAHEAARQMNLFGGSDDERLRSKARGAT